MAETTTTTMTTTLRPRTARIVAGCATLCAAAAATAILSSDPEAGGIFFSPSAPSPCYVARGGPGGRWERDVPLAELTHYDPNYPAYSRANQYHVPDASDPAATRYRKPETYAWRDPPGVEGRCGRVVPLSAASFCIEARRLGLSRIMFVGDSIAFQQSYAFARQVGSDVEHKNYDGKNSAQGWMVRHECPGEYAVELRFARNDRLLVGDMIPDTTNKGDVLRDWIDVYRSEPPSVRTLLVVNTGPHFIRDPNPPYETVVDKFLEDVGTKIGRPRDLVFFRTSPGGHPTCATATEPFRTQEEYYDSVEHPPAEHANVVPKYGWGKFGAMNDYLKEALGGYNDGTGVGVTSGPKRIHVLDVEPMTNLRPDGHQTSPDNRDPDKPEWDCLHYSMPGPIDWFNNLLFTNLADLPSLEEEEQESAAAAESSGALRTRQDRESSPSTTTN
mmetsp:Transcript_32056/g.96041  ORF Transcript_32056/g.96041 Transcript_32056/m.96041 type:complete len:445 (-) Transcript_32056:47-1381(-)